MCEVLFTIPNMKRTPLYWKQAWDFSADPRISADFDILKKKKKKKKKSSSWAAM